MPIGVLSSYSRLELCYKFVNSSYYKTTILLKNYDIPCHLLM